MKKYFIPGILYLLTIQTAIAQSVGIGTTNPNPSARLEVNSTTQGILIPKLTSAQRSAISNPATGLLVFQSDGTPGFYYYTGTNWVNLTNGQPANIEGFSSGYGHTTTFAGNGIRGSTDGLGTNASFNSPHGVAVDISGNIYVADIGSHKIRKITPGGFVSTLAGSGTIGSHDGMDTAASFYFPGDVAVDASGNIYVADLSNFKIRKINTAGEVTTLAGSGIRGDMDGSGTSAQFDYPAGVAVDASGNVYVAEMGSNKIRKINTAGEVTTLAGNGMPGNADGAGTAAQFSSPMDIALDASGNIYVADRYNNRIRKITPGGIVSTFAGSGSRGSADGIGIAASFDEPFGLAVDAWDNLYVSDYNNHKIRKITPSGVVSTLAGSGLPGGLDGAGNAANFNYPNRVVVDASGNVYVTETGNYVIRKIIAQ